MVVVMLTRSAAVSIGSRGIGCHDVVVFIVVVFFPNFKSASHTRDDSICGIRPADIRKRSAPRDVD